MSDHPVVPRSDGERERQIRERLAKATPGPWSWTRSYELPNDESPTGYARHWALHNPEGTAKGMVTDSHLVLYSAAPKDIGGRPMEQRPDFALIANAPADLAWLLSLVDDLREQIGRAQDDAERWRFYRDTDCSLWSIVRDGKERWVVTGDDGDPDHFEADTADEAIDSAMSAAVARETTNG